MKESITERNFDLEVKTLFDKLAQYVKLSLDEKFDKKMAEFDECLMHERSCD